MDKKQDTAMRAAMEARRLARHFFALINSTRAFNGESGLFEVMLTGNAFGKAVGDYYAKMIETNGPETGDDWLTLTFRHMVTSAEEAGIKLDVKFVRRDNGSGQG